MSAPADTLVLRGLSIETRPGRGRCLVATRAFAVGDLLLEEPPYASVVSDGSSACDACGRQSASLKRCGGCRLVSFCDASCQRASFLGTHKAECTTLAALRTKEGRAPPPTLRLLHRFLLRRAQGADEPQQQQLLQQLVSQRSTTDQEVLLSCAQMASLFASYACTHLASVEEATELLLVLRLNAHTTCDCEACRLLFLARRRLTVTRSCGLWAPRCTRWLPW